MHRRPGLMRGGILRDSIVISGTNGVGLVTVLVTDALSAAYFGLSAEMDAYLIAAAVPQVLWSVCSSVGARVLVPFFTKAEQEGEQDSLSRVLGALTFYGGGVALLLALLVALVAFVVGRLSLGGRSAWTFFLILLSVCPSLLAEPLRAAHLVRRRFAVASMTEVVRYIVVIVSVLLLGRTLGVTSLAVGHLVGSAVQVVWLGATYRFLEGRLVLRADAAALADAGIVQRLGPAFAGELVGQANIPIERFLGSFLPTGTVSALGYGRRILRALQSLLVSSVGSALLPGLSKQALERKAEGLKQVVANGIRLATVVAGLAVVLVIDSRVQLTALLLERGAFDRAATLVTSRYVALFVPSVLFMAATYLLINVLFALDESRTVMHMRIAFLGIYLVLGVLFNILLPQTGLAYAYTASQLVYFAVAGAVVARRLPGIGRDLIDHFLRLGSGITLMLVGLSMVRRLSFWPGAHLGSGILTMLVSTAIIVPVYLVLVLLLRILRRDDLARWIGHREWVAPRSS